MLSFPESPDPWEPDEQAEGDEPVLPEVDLQALAEEILSLLKKELREEHERAGISSWH